MTQTMLERAARAAWDAVCATNDPTTIARAVLNAVRVPSEAMSQAVRTTEGWEDMIDAILSETAQPSPPPRV